MRRDCTPDFNQLPVLSDSLSLSTYHFLSTHLLQVVDQRRLDKADAKLRQKQEKRAQKELESVPARSPVQ